MALVYSVQFFRGFVPTAFTEVFTAPAADTLVVRDMEFYNGGAANTLFNCQVGTPGSTGVFYQNSTMASSSWTQWTGRVVIAPGQGLWLYATAANMQAVISGYHFVGP